MMVLAARTEARIRVVDHLGRLQADSVPPLDTVEASDLASYSLRKTTSLISETQRSVGRDTWLYRVTVYPLNVVRKLLLPPDRPLPSAEYYSGRSVLEGPEITAALAGRYGAATRISEGQRSVTLYSAIPIPNRDGGIIGAVLVSQSTFKILSDLYVLRLDVIRIFFLALTAAVVLSFLLSWTITIPVHRLRVQAESLLDHRGKLRGTIAPGKGKDEIALLRRSLHGLSVKLEERQNYLDNFLSDTVHEINNPVTGAATSLELARDALGSPDFPREMIPAVEQALRFIAAAEEEIHRVRHLTADLREMNFLENRIGEEAVTELDLTGYLTGLIDAYAPGMAERRGIILRGVLPDREVFLSINPDRLTQALVNLLLNAESFSPPGGMVTLSLRPGPARVDLLVSDQGPGIPPGNEDRIFQRFFSDRPAASAGGQGPSANNLLQEPHDGTSFPGSSAPSEPDPPPDEGEEIRNPGIPSSAGLVSKDEGPRPVHSGLGLAIVKAIVEGFGGTVALDRNYTAGACFILSWPGSRFSEP
jgi:two-component system sensor histidine kinase ChvG